jgi:hypothetical protein
MSRAILLALLLPLTLGGCSKFGGEKGAPGADASTPSASASALAAPSASASAPRASASAVTGPAASAATYAGTYTVAPATLHIPESKDYAHVKQAKDEPSKMVGNGTLSLSVAADGRVTGEIDSGPAAPALVDGSLVGGEIRGVVLRKAPSDDGLTGTIVAKIGDASVDGKLSLAEANAAIVREGTVSLKKK